MANTTRVSEDLKDRFCSRIVTGFLTKTYTKRKTSQTENETVANLMRDAIEQACSWKRRYLKLASEVQREGVKS